MCGRYSLFTPQADLEERFGAQFVADFDPRYNAAPGQALPVITDDAPDEIRRVEWGLVPTWADDDSSGLINARAETLAEKPSFRDAYRRGGGEGGEKTDDSGNGQADGGPDRDGEATAGRCLVLADGFYEWVEGDEGTGRKQPYRVAFGDDRSFAMAGLWTRWEPETRQTGLGAFGGGSGDDGDDTEADAARRTFTVVTTEPNDLVADLHHRMAAILDPDDERGWLTAADPRDVLGPHPADEMRAYPVSTAVNSPATDEPSLVESVEP